MQATWAGGYAADLPYLPTYLTAQAPAELEAACALAGAHTALPREGLHVLDIGCGRGMGALALAAANPSWTVTGIDYMPAHVGEAREIAAEAGLENARFLEADLAALDEAAAAALLPEFDVATMHGVWTWVSDAVRAGVLALLRARLRPGGLALVSYNALPGWAEESGLRRLLCDLVPLLNGPVDRRMAQALAVARRLHAAGAAMLTRSSFMRRLADEHPASLAAFARYAVHEFLPTHWRPAYPQEVAEALAAAKLDFVASAAVADHLPALALGAEERAAIDALPEGLNRAFLHDLFHPRTLRQDVFVRGRRPADRAQILSDLPLALRLLPADGRAPLALPGGVAELPAPVIGAALEALAASPCTLGALLALPAMQRTGAEELLAVLVGSRVAAPAWRAATTPAMQARARRFNRVVLRRFGALAQESGSSVALAVPLLGAGLPCKPLEAGALIALEDAAASGLPAPDVAAIARGMVAEGTPPDALAATEAIIRAGLAERVTPWRVLGML
jgi:SAM-dependent methyltransferase